MEGWKEARERERARECASEGGKKDEAEMKGSPWRLRRLSGRSPGPAVE